MRTVSREEELLEVELREGRRSGSESPVIALTLSRDEV